MANMESFYGGRQGASFILVKHFDCIDSRSEGCMYKKKSFLIDNYGRVLLDDNGKPIEKTGFNHNDTIYSKILTYDGSTIYNGIIETTQTPQTFTLQKEIAEGMLQCFCDIINSDGDITYRSKGKESLSEVNYGEYVIIDTTGIQDLDNPDNGKVFKRIIEDTSKDPNDIYRYVEYVGQINGPQGSEGQKGGIHILCKITQSPSELTPNMQNVPPEEWFGNEKYAGWGIIVQRVGENEDTRPYYWYFDYSENNRGWIEYGIIDNILPENIIFINNDRSAANNTLLDGGIYIFVNSMQTYYD